MNRVDLPRTNRSMACNFARKKLWFELFEERVLLDAELGSLMGDSLVVPDTDETVPSTGIHSQWLYDAQGHSLKNLALRSKSDSGTSSEDGLTRIVSENGPAEKWKPSSDTVPHAGLSTHVGSVSMVWGGTDRQVMPGSWVAHVSNQTSPMSDEAEFVGVPDLSGTMLQLTSQIGNGDWLQVEAPAYYTAEMVRSELGRRAMVLSVQPVFADYSESTIPNDPYFPGQKNLLKRMDVTEAWGATGSERGTTSVVVAVNDTAVDYTHPDLYRNIWLNQSEIPVGLTFVDSDADGLITFWDLNAEANLGATADLNGNGYIDAGDLLFPLSEGGWSDGIDGGANGFVDDLIGWDFAHDDNDPYPYDEYYENAHGTSVAGAIGATGNDHFGIAGITWKTQLMVVSGLDEFGFGTDVALASAIDYAVANGARVTNASWNGPYSELIDLAVQNADAAQHLVVAAAGNDGTDNDTMPEYAYPASLPYDNVLSVTATDEFDYSYTNYGATTVDLAAAESVLSTVPLWYFGSGQWTDAYEIMFGTSMAASLVTGTAALLWSTNPSANSAEIRDAILAGVDLVPDLDLVTGTHPVATGGRLNVFGSLRQLHSMDLFVQATSPSEGETVFGSQPTVYSVTFNSPVQLSLDPSDLQASDFTVNAVPATGVDLSPDSLTATFTFVVPPLSKEGLITTSIAPGAVRGNDMSETLAGGYEGTFRYDSVALNVIAVDPAPGTVFEPSIEPFHFRLYFNEAFDPSSLSGSIFRHPFSPYDFGYSFFLNMPVGPYNYIEPPTSSIPALNNTALDLTFDSVDFPFRNEGPFSLNFEAEKLSDFSGNDNPSFFEAMYTTDIVSSPYGVPLTAFSPLGSMIASGATVDGLINPGLPTDDVDDYTLNIDAGETLTVQVFIAATTLRPQLQIYNPFNTLVASGVSVSDGGKLLLQSIPTLIGGLYTIRVSGANHSTGTFSLHAILNASLEEEGRKKRAYNDSTSSAQSIDTSFVRFSTDLESSSRGSLVGALGNVADGIPNATILYSADFEAGNDGFAVVNDNGRNSLWNRTERRGNEAGHSSTHSFWYGNPDTGTYVTGGGGSMVSPAINLPNPVGVISLDFNYFLQSDANTTFDVRVGVSNDGGATFGLFDAPFPTLAQTSGGWSASNLYDLSSYKGKLIRLFFGFHTRAGFDTTREGVFIDDIKIYRNALPKDNYSLSARAGERFSLNVVQFSGDANPSLVKIELIGADQTTVLATGVGGASNIGGAINVFIAPTNGTYFVQLTSPTLDAGASGIITYALLITKDAVFDLEPNDSSAAAQSTAGTKAAIGYVEPPSAVDSGWYDSSGVHGPSNTNYLVGQLQSFGVLKTYRDWFVFDVPAISGLITTASIELFNPNGGYRSSDANETLTLFDVITPISTLRAGGIRPEIYNDLGVGASYGSVTVDATNNNSLIVVNLNAVGLAALNLAKGGQIALGGALTSLVGTADQYLFASTNPAVNSSHARRLILNGERLSSDWYSVTLGSDQTALQVETRTPGDGPGEIRNALNPRIELYDVNGTSLIASGVALSDGRNEKILVSGLSSNATYKLRVLGEANSVGEYYLTATPLRVPKVELPVFVGDGTAQRSNVKQLQVTFDGIVNIANLNSGAFTVRQRGDSGGVVVSQATESVVNNRTLVTLNFSGLFTEASGSLKDGNYDLTIDATQITRNGLRLDGDSDGSAGGDYHFGSDQSGNLKATDNFFRFFGDADGDRDVDALDLSLFNLAFRKPPNAYTAIFDFDADNDVDGLDLSQFSRRFRKSLR